MSIFFSVNVKADVFSDMLNQLAKEVDLQTMISKYTEQTADSNQQMLSQLSNTPGLNFETKSYDPNLQSWGSNLSTWQSVLNAYQNGDGKVGVSARDLNHQFPIQSSTLINPNPNSIDAKFYTLQAQTALASRAASQHDYDNIQNQIDYMHKLLKMIGETKTVKDALDLQNRIQVENSLIQLELLRLSSLSNQQQSIETQGEVNSYINNANTGK